MGSVWDIPFPVCVCVCVCACECVCVCACMSVCRQAKGGLRGSSGWLEGTCVMWLRDQTHSLDECESGGQCSFSPLLIKVGLFSVHYTHTHTHTHTCTCTHTHKHARTHTHTHTAFIEWVIDSNNTGEAHLYFAMYLHFCCVCAPVCARVCECLCLCVLCVFVGLWACCQ